MQKEWEGWRENKEDGYRDVRHFVRKKGFLKRKMFEDFM